MDFIPIALFSGRIKMCIRDRFSFMAAWSNYLLFNVLIFNSKTPVLATYLRKVASNDEMIADYGIFCAMALIYMPVSYTHLKIYTLNDARINDSNDF